MSYLHDRVPLRGYPYWERDPAVNPMPFPKRRFVVRFRRQGPRCSICGSPISAPLSLERGVGPVCWHRR